MRAYQSLHRFLVSACWSSWLTRIAQNVCRDALRRRRVRAAAELDANHSDGAPSPEARALMVEGSRILLDAVEKLPEKFRVPIVMRYEHERTYKEIAEALNLRESTVVGRLAGALRILRRRMRGTEI